MPEIIYVKPNDRHLITQFLSENDRVLKKFRYFKERSLDVLDNHLATYVIREGSQVLGYGHLDREEEVIWLGIAIAQDWQGLGLGRLLLQHLVVTARMQQLTRIRLAVDTDNRPAIRLYEQAGFKLLKQKDAVSYYQLEL